MFLIYLGAFLASALVFAQGYDLFEAARAGDSDAVRSIVNGPNFEVETLNATDDENQSPLYVAMNNGHVDVALELIKKTDNFNLLQKQDYETYLHLAIRREDLTPCLEEMLNRKANPNIPNIEGRTALHCATSLGDRSGRIIDLLIKKGEADTEMTDGTGYTALHRAIEEENVAAVVALCENGADVEAKTPSEMVGIGPRERNALHHAIYVGNLDVIKAIVETGKADIEKKDPFGQTGLHAALFKSVKSPDMALYLLSCNADVNAGDGMDAFSILEMALRTRHKDLVAAILAKNPVAAFQLTQGEIERAGPLGNMILLHREKMNPKDEGPSDTTSRSISKNRVKKQNKKRRRNEPGL